MPLNPRRSISNTDTTLPELQAFTVFPQEFTPNQDGLDDRVLIRYYLTKPARPSALVDAVRAVLAG